MDVIPNDIILIIFDNIKLITDKRQFLRTCSRYNKITKRTIQTFEDNYSINGFNKINNYCVEKFTLELCHDLYFDMIPNSYVNPDNNILVRALVKFNCIKMLEMAKNNGCDLKDVGSFGSYYINLDAIKWGIDNGYVMNETAGIILLLVGAIEKIVLQQNQINILDGK